MRGRKTGSNIQQCVRKTCDNGAYFDNIKDIKAINPNNAIEVTNIRTNENVIPNTNNQRVSFQSYKEDGYTKWPLILGKINKLAKGNKYGPLDKH